MTLLAITMVVCNVAQVGTNSWILPRPMRYVADYAQLLDQDKADRLNAVLQGLELRAGVPYVVLTVQDTAGIQLPWYAARTAMAWGLRKQGRDRGVLFVYVASGQRFRLEYGTELNHILTPGLREELGQLMASYIDSNSISEGIYHVNLQAAQAIASAFSASIADPLQTIGGLSPQARQGPVYNLIGLVGLALIIMAMVWIRRSYARWTARSKGTGAAPSQTAQYDQPFEAFGGGTGAFGVPAGQCPRSGRVKD